MSTLRSLLSSPVFRQPNEIYNRDMSQRENAIWLRLTAIFALLFGTFLLFTFEAGASRLRQARLAEEQGNYRQAAQLYHEAAQVLFWQRVVLQERAAQNSRRVGENSQVIALLAPLQEYHSLSYQAKTLLAKAYLDTANPDAAMSLRQELAQQGYPTHDLDSLLLKLYSDAGRYEQTLPLLRDLVAAQPQDAEWHYRLGLVLAAEAPAEAIQPLQKAAELDDGYQLRVSLLLEQLNQPAPEKALAFLYGGRGLATIGEWKLAERAFQHAVEQRPDFAEAWAYMGIARFRLSPPSPSPTLQNQSIEEERRASTNQQEPPGLFEIRYALKLNPRSQLALAFLTLIWQELGRTQLALQSAEQAFRLYPDDLNVRLQYAQALAQAGNLEGGWQVMQERLTQSSTLQAARKALILFCVQYGYRLSESALPLARELVSQMPKDAESLDLLGQVYLGLEEYTLAQQSFERALSLDAGYAPAVLHLGMVHLAQGNTALARTQFQRAVEIAPFSPSGEQARRYLEVYLP